MVQGCGDIVRFIKNHAFCYYWIGLFNGTAASISFPESPPLSTPLCAQMMYSYCTSYSL